MIRRSVPRVLIGGTGSGCGKTTVVCGLLSALIARGVRPAAFKCGPDYIDPMFHRSIIGAPSANLDLFLCGEEALRYLLAEDSAGCDISVIEGAMGIYDGESFDDDTGSANHTARVTETPEILVLDVRGRSASLLAEAEGYLDFGDNNIEGVILNRCSSKLYPRYRQALESRLPVKVLGFMDMVPDASFADRHLGLVAAGEIGDLKERMRRLGEAAGRGLDIEAILEMARTAPGLSCRDFRPRNICGGKNLRIAVARDQAFCFYYEDCLRYLEQLGAELVPFSPLADGTIPRGISGMLLGGGYPELHAAALEANLTMRTAIREAAGRGLPVYAECGGFMYLCQSIDNGHGSYQMAGVLPAKAHMTPRPVRFGYKTLTAVEDNILCRRGESIRCHEFHYSDCDDTGRAFTAVDRRGRVSGEMFSRGNVLAGYQHIHFFGGLSFAENFIRSCLRWSGHASASAGPRGKEGGRC